MRSNSGGPISRQQREIMWPQCWDRRRPRLLRPNRILWLRVQARTPAVPAPTAQRMILARRRS